MSKEELKKYDIVFCLSREWINTIDKWHKNVISEPLLSCTNFDLPQFDFSKDNIDDVDILYVGNARGGLEYGRKSVYWLDPPEGTKVKVYGHKWHLPRFEWMKDWFAGQYFDYNDLNKIYNLAKITLVDGHEDMGEKGFVPMKIFDVLASGGFVLSNKNSGIKEIFGNCVPQFNSKNEMNDLVKHYLKNDAERKQMSEKGRLISKSHTYKDRALSFISAFENYKRGKQS
jgi:spore maturation protein CgeB